MNEILKKRIEVAAKEHQSKQPYCNDLKVRGMFVGYRKGFIAGAYYALSHQLISVDKALPEDDEYVIALTSGLPVIAKGIHVREELKDITHWMPKFEAE